MLIGIIQTYELNKLNKTKNAMNGWAISIHSISQNSFLSIALSKKENGRFLGCRGNKIAKKTQEKFKKLNKFFGST